MDFPALTIEMVNFNTKDLKKIEELYCRAFPENERRPFSELISGKNSCAGVWAFYEKEQLCGFACLLDTQDISHIIYLAIEEQFRDKGYGSRVLAAIHKQKTGKRVIVDIERQSDSADNNGQRQRRKQFYLRNGYRETEVKYRWEHEDYEILAYGGDVSEEDFSMFWKQLEAGTRKG